MRRLRLPAGRQNAGLTPNPAGPPGVRPDTRGDRLMASDKQKRKLSKKPRPAGTPHPDGDRRRRGGPNVDQAIRDKAARRNWPGPPPAE